MTVLPDPQDVPEQAPGYVPTLTEKVSDEGATGSDALIGADYAATGTDLEEQIVHRVMQRVDVALEYRLRDAVALVVKEQTRNLLPRLREEVESVVRQSVYGAVADELAQTMEPSEEAHAIPHNSGAG